jgi:hypothetical protein
VSRASAFAAIPLDQANHFQVNYNAAVFHLLDHVRRMHAESAGDWDRILNRHPFLTGYLDATVPYLPDGLLWEDAPGWWAKHIHKWETSDPDAHLPILTLRAVGLDFPARMAVLLAGMVDEEPRFGALLSETQVPGNHRRPTLTTIASAIHRPDAWALAEMLDSIGLLPPADGEDSFVEATPRVPADVWSAVRGGAGLRGSWYEHLGADQLPRLDELVLSDSLLGRLTNLPVLLADSGHRAVVLRGMRGSGRRQVAGAVAQAVGHGAVHVEASALDEPRTRLLGLLCTVLSAVPVISFELTPGQTALLPGLTGYTGPTLAILGSEGGLEGPALERAITIQVPRAGSDQRRVLWEQSLPGVAAGDLDLMTDRFRLPIVHIGRVASSAVATAMLDGREVPTLDDVRAATSTLNRQRLDTLATRLDPVGGWESLVVDEQTTNRLAALARRCRHRERVLDHAGPAFGSANSGVRALFTGPSGTGKTLAARILAAELGMDLYRVDLSAIVNKYVGETEKNLHRVLSTAEELDIILLIDEGDSLLGNRTEVRSANDRFANLETNYLLQRLEVYDGIVLVTSNAAENIDPAFQRRMDAVVTLVEPGPHARWEIWQLHLPVDHQVTPDVLDDVAGRADMTGGQIRNAAFQATLLALDDGTAVRSSHVERAVALEYGKAGAVSPFQRTVVDGRRTRAEAFLEALP